MNYFSILFLLSFLHTIFTNQDFILTSTNYFHHIYCNDNFYIKINSIKFFYNQYNCTIVLHQHEKMKNICLNQSSCILNLKTFLFSHVQHYITECRTIKLKSIRLNYTCVNETFKSINRKNYSILIYTKNTIILCISIIIVISLLALFCSYLRHFSIDKQENNTQLINDNKIKQEYEMKNLLIVESSSLSTLTSLNNKNIITNPSEYDNLIKIEHLSPLKVKFNENYQM